MPNTTVLPPYDKVAEEFRGTQEEAKGKALSQLIVSEKAIKAFTDKQSFLRHLRSYINVGIAQGELAAWAGTSQANLSRWLREQACPPEYSRPGIIKNINDKANECVIEIMEKVA